MIASQPNDIVAFVIVQNSCTTKEKEILSFLQKLPISTTIYETDDLVLQSRWLSKIYLHNSDFAEMLFMLQANYSPDHGW